MSGIMMLSSSTAGGSGPASTIEVLPQDIIDSVASPSTASAAFKLDNDGYVYQITSSGGTVQLQQWCVPAANASQFEAFVTVTYGTVTGTTGSWLSLGTDRTWTKTVSAAIGYNFVTFTVGIREIGGDGTILSTADIKLEGLSS